MDEKCIPEVIIRKPCPEDASMITELCFQLGYPTEPGGVSAKLAGLSEDEEHAIYVAELKGQGVVGWVHVFIYKPFHCDFMAEVAGLVVDKACRGKGVGKQLMQAVEAWARDKCCAVVSLRSNIIRKEAHCFYKNLGYEIIKESYTFRKKI